jgi:ankyrin repeat protein
MSKEEELIKAAREGKLGAVQSLLSSKMFGLVKPADINWQDKDTLTPLIHAAMKGHKEVVELLIKSGADINKAHKDGFTALMGAAKFGFPEIALMLIKNGANIHAEKSGEDSGWTALIFAAWQGKLDVARVLVQHGARVNSSSTVSHWTSLLWALEKGHDEVARFLLEEGADVNAEDNEHFTPLMCASKFGRLAIARILIEKGANVNASKSGKDEGWTALMFASWQGKADIIKLLLEYGADVNAKTCENWTPLMWAAREGHTDVASLLIEKGAQVNLRSDKGYTALGLAAFNGYLDIVKKLIEAGADINAKDDQGESALKKAENKEFPDIVRYLRGQRAKEPPVPQHAAVSSGFPANPNACISIILKDSSMMGDAGAGGTAFNNAIQSLNNKDDKQAELYFKQSLNQGLDTLRQGYAHANLGVLSIRNNDLKSAIHEFIKVLNYKEALHESVHDAVQYLSIIYDVLNEPVLIPPLQILKSKTMAKLNYSLSPEATAKVRDLAERQELDTLEKEFMLSDSGSVASSGTPSRESIKQHITQKNLRPFGNKKRLLFKEGQACNAYMALFGDKQKLEKYYHAYIDFAIKNPPPLPIEVMMAYAPKNIHPQKFSFVYPYTGSGASGDYQAWAREAILTCNDVVRQDTYLAGDYASVPSNIDVVLDWDILLPAGFSLDSPQAEELFTDPPEAGFRAMKVQIAGESTVPEKPNPQGPWVGILFKINTFEEALYGRAATKLFLELVGAQTAAGTIIRGGDILPDCRYWCTAVHTESQEQAQAIIKAITNATNDKLAPSGSRILQGTALPVGTLPYQGFISSKGTYIGS